MDPDGAIPAIPGVSGETRPRLPGWLADGCIAVEAVLAEAVLIGTKNEATAAMAATATITDLIRFIRYRFLVNRCEDAIDAPRRMAGISLASRQRRPSLGRQVHARQASPPGPDRQLTRGAPYRWCRFQRCLAMKLSRQFDRQFSPPGASGKTGTFRDEFDSMTHDERGRRSPGSNSSLVSGTSSAAVTVNQLERMV
jgi:hypothetical protein